MSKPVVEVQLRAVVLTSGGCAVFLGNEGQGIRDVRRSKRWNGDRDVYGRHTKGAVADPRSASDHLASARSKDRKGDRQRSQAGHLFCETWPQRGERIATEEDHRDRCTPQRLYSDGDSAARPDLHKP